MSEMVELRLKVDREFLDELKKRLHTNKASEVVQQALGVYDWATEEAKSGRVIVSSNTSGEELKQLVTTPLSTLRSKA